MGFGEESDGAELGTSSRAECGEFGGEAMEIGDEQEDGEHLVRSRSPARSDSKGEPRPSTILASELWAAEARPPIRRPTRQN